MLLGMALALLALGSKAEVTAYSANASLDTITRTSDWSAGTYLDTRKWVGTVLMVR
jgi:hypothetical protein